MIVNRNPNRPNLVSVTPSGFFGKTSENIGFIDNFLTSSELTRLSECAKGNLQWDE